MGFLLHNQPVHKTKIYTAQPVRGQQTPTVAPPFDRSNLTALQNTTEKLKKSHVEIIPERVEKTSIINTVEQFSKKVGDVSNKTLLMVSLAFLFMFFVLSASKLYSDHNKAQRSITTDIQSEMRSRAQAASGILQAQSGWIDAALLANTTPNNIVNFVMRGNNIVGAALITSDGQLIARSNGADILSQVDVSNFPQSGMRITSIIAKDGSINPVIVRRIGDRYLTVALTPNSLTGAGNDSIGIVTPTGRAIDGSKALGIAAPLNFYSLTDGRLDQITKSASVNSVDSHQSHGKKVWLGANRIPDSSLTILSINPRTLSSEWVQSLILFLTLFLATCALVATLMRNMYEQIQNIQKASRASEISEQRFKAAVDSTGGGIWEIDLTRNEVFLSQSLSQLVGLGGRETTLPIPQFLGLFHPTDREKLYGLIRRAHMTGDFEIDLRVARIPITMSCRGKPSFRGDNQNKAVIGIGMDVTEHRGAQARLQATENRLNNALSSMTDSFVIWDAMNRLVIWNGRFENYFGFTAGQLQPGLEYTTIEYYMRQAIAEVVERENDTAYDILLNDGRWVRYRETTTADGGRLSVGTDLTPIRAREEELQTNQSALEKTINVLRKSQVRIVELAENYEQEKIRAEEANQSKSEFLANMSHELRTPLNAINGFSDIMKKEMFGPLGDPRYKEYINDILFSGQHLLSLINDILDMSKIEAGKMTLNTEAMHIHDIIQQIIRIVRGRAEDNRLKLVYNANELPEIEADTRAVKQVLLNLATNAIKFTPEGGVVSIETHANSAGIIVKIADSGIGIAQDDLDRLAKPFEQIESEHSRQHEGTGLGLALSKSLVELHGGNFTIESVLGEGTTVTFTLPNRPPETKVTISENEVGNEISRLAKDIADVLTDQNSEVSTDYENVQEVRPLENQPTVHQENSNHASSDINTDIEQNSAA